MDVGNLISGSSVFSKSSLNIRKFTVHILLQPSLENFERYFAANLPAASLLWVQSALRLKSQSENESCLVLSSSLWPQGLYNPWNSPSQNTGVGSLSLLQGIFPTQGLNPGFLHHRQILYHLIHKGSPFSNPVSGYLISAGCSENNKTYFSPLRLLWARAEVEGEIGDSKLWIWRCSKMPWKAKNKDGEPKSERCQGKTSLVVQWLNSTLPVQEVRFWSLVEELRSRIPYATWHHPNKGFFFFFN